MVERRVDRAISRSAAWRRFQQLAGGEARPRAALQTLVRGLVKGTEHPPTDLDAVAKRLGVVRIESADLPVSGEVRVIRGELCLLVAPGLSHGRRRFTIAHELGHVLLRQSGPGYPRAGQATEALCDMFAGELLMPRGVFNVGAGLKPDDVVALARRFQTSLYAAAVRCCDLASISAFAVVNEKLEWSCGRVFRIEDGFRDLIRRVNTGEGAREVVYRRLGRTTEPWWVEGTPLRQPGRSFFLLKRATLAS